MTDTANEASPPEATLLGGGAERAAYRALLRNDRFRNLFLAMLTSSLGDWLGLFAILALTESLAGASRAGAFALSGIMVARVLPTMVLGPVAGVFVDRWDRKRTLIVTDIGRGAVMVLVALVGDVFQLAMATFLIEVMSTLFIPAKDATVPNLVARERLVPANQLSLMATYGTLPLGAAAFAALVGLSNLVLGDVAFFAERPAALAIWVNAATFFLSAIFIRRIRIDAERRNGRAQRATTSGPGAWTELKEGFRFIATQPLIRALVVGVMAAFLAAGVVASGVGKLFTTVLNAGDSGFGILGAVAGAGLFLGLTTAGVAARHVTKERLFAPGIGVAGVALVVTAFMPRLDLAGIPAFVMGAGAGLSFVTGYTLLQERADDEVRGRTFAAFNTGVRAALFTSLVVGPLLVGIIGVEPNVGGFYPYRVGGVRLTLVLAGLVALTGAVWTGRAIRDVLDGHDDLELVPSAPAPLRRRSGLFVVFEGGEGAGKTTQIELLARSMRQAGFAVTTTREPGGTPVGERVRDILLDRASDGMADRAEALLFAAARAQLADEVIRPTLEGGGIVLCDRYVDSSIVYQGIARGLGDHQIEELNRWGTTGLRPDLVVLLDVDPGEGLRRAGDVPDRMEAGGTSFHRSVNDAYRRRAQADPGRYLVLDASRPVDELHGRIHAAVLARLQPEVPA